MNDQPQQPLQRLSALLDKLLDQSYARQAMPALKALTADPRLVNALNMLTAEAQRLQKAGETLAPDNPALLHLRDTLDRVLHRQTARIDIVGQSLQQDAINQAGNAARQLALPGISDQQLASLGVQWNHPDPAAVAKLVNYANSSAWADALDKFGEGVAEKIGKLAALGIASGKGPIETARQVKQAVEAIPRAEAEKMIRTLQLTSYRQASATNYVANADVVEYLIRYEALDDRCCISCVALHGTRLEVGDSVDEHWNGRGVAIPVIKGFTREIETGEQWLESQPEDKQRSIMGDAAYNAWNAGAVNLSDFVEHTIDPIFGPMIVENSLKGVLGDGAKKYYAYNQ